MKILKELRLKKGARQEDVANVIGVSYQAYANYENGHRRPSIDILMALSRYFNVSIDFLVGNEVEINQTPQLTMHEQYVLSMFNALSDKAQSLAVSYLEGMYAGEHQVVPIIINNKEN